jgi:hypothetical protein
MTKHARPPGCPHTIDRKPVERQFKRIRRGDTSRQGNLAVNYLDAHALCIKV